MADEGEYIEVLRKKTNRTQTERHAHEVRPVAPADRRAMLAKPTKNTQLNVKITAILKRDVSAAALIEGVSLASYVEAALFAYLRRKK